MMNSKWIRLYNIFYNRVILQDIIV
jgi:hypothetical protein